MVWCALILAGVARCHGQQVAPVVHLTGDVISTLVANTGLETQTVTAGLYFPRYDGVTPDTLRPVPSIVSLRFTLQPGERQTIGLIVRGAVPTPARLLMCWTPTARPVARVAIVSRLCLNALAKGGGP